MISVPTRLRPLAVRMRVEQTPESWGPPGPAPGTGASPPCVRSSRGTAAADGPPGVRELTADRRTVPLTTRRRSRCPNWNGCGAGETSRCGNGLYGGCGTTPPPGGRVSAGSRRPGHHLPLLILVLAPVILAAVGPRCEVPHDTRGSLGEGGWIFTGRLPPTGSEQITSASDVAKSVVAGLDIGRLHGYSFSRSPERQ